MKKEENRMTKVNTRIIITIILLLVVIISGTFAWFTFSSKKTALVLTIGNIDATQITLYPYEFNGTLNPVSSYEDPSVSYTQVTAINNNNISSSFDLTYNTEGIEEEFRSSYVKYTITKSVSKNTGYEFYDDGNLSGLTSDAPIILLEDEKIDPNTTLYYRVYLWLDNNEGDHSLLQGKTLSVRLNAKLNGLGAPDLQYNVVNLSNNNSNTLYSNKIYELTNYSCENGTELSFDKITRRITANGIDRCNLNFTETTKELLYNVVEIGDYIEYTGDNGCSGNQCTGRNAAQTESKTPDDYGYCYSPENKYYTYGWRVLYKKDNSVYIVSAGAPECIAGANGDSATTKTKLNTAALKYCNEAYVSGGNCDAIPAPVHAFNGDDFYEFTIQYYGSNNGRYLYTFDDGSAHASSTTYSCYNKYSQMYCGYNNSILDNGGYYWFASGNSATYTHDWNPNYRNVHRSNSTREYGVRPVIKLDSTIKVTGGIGSMDKPYKINSTNAG